MAKKDWEGRKGEPSHRLDLCVPEIRLSGRVRLVTRQHSQRGFPLLGWTSAWLTDFPALWAPSQRNLTPSGPLPIRLLRSSGEGREVPSQPTPCALCSLQAPLLGCPGFARPVAHLVTGFSPSTMKSAHTLNPNSRNYWVQCEAVNRVPSLESIDLCSRPTRFLLVVNLS